MTHQFSKLVLTAGLSALLGTTAAFAQDKAEVADVPFAFHAAQKTLPAGNYRIAEQTSNGVFCLRDAEGHSILISMRPGNTSNPEQPKLTFVRDGGEYVLSGVSMPGSTEGWARSDSAIQKDLTHRLSVAALISVPLTAR